MNKPTDLVADLTPQSGRESSSVWLETSATATYQTSKCVSVFNIRSEVKDKKSPKWTIHFKNH